MKNRLKFAAITVLSLTSFALVGCSEEVSHTESDKPRMFKDGRVKEETTTVKNPDGTTSTQKKTTVTGN